MCASVSLFSYWFASVSTQLRLFRPVCRSRCCTSGANRTVTKARQAWEELIENEFTDSLRRRPPLAQSTRLLFRSPNPSILINCTAAWSTSNWNAVKEGVTYKHEDGCIYFITYIRLFHKPVCPCGRGSVALGHILCATTRLCVFCPI